MKKLIICLISLCLCHAVSAGEQLTYGELETFFSKSFSNSREYSVHLPDGYEEELDRLYPVLYVLHGQWDLMSTVAVTDAISNAIPNLIIIGVNSQGPELKPAEVAGGSHNIRGEQFRSFLLQELLPHIKQTYRVAEFSILSGHSNSGRFVLNSFLDDPGTFSAYFAFSPSLDDGVFNKRVTQNPSAFTHNQSVLMITLANEGEHMQVPYDELVSLFEASDLSSKNFFHKEFPEQSHQPAKIVSMQYSLETLFDGWQPTGAVQQQGLVGLQKHYAGLTAKYGFEVPIPIHYLLRVTYFYSASDVEEENLKAAAIVKYSLERDPLGVDEFVDLLEALNNQGEEKGARRLTTYICEAMSAHEICDHG